MRLRDARPLLQGDAFVEALPMVLGDAVTRVWYRGADEEHKWANSKRAEADEVAQSVSLLLGADALEVAWASIGWLDGIMVRERRGAELDEGEVDVSFSTPWRDVLSVPISEVALAWHLPDGEQVAAWAIRLSFANGMSATIALGELIDRELSFHPRGLVVIHDEAGAREFCPEHTMGCAFGERVK